MTARTSKQANAFKRGARVEYTYGGGKTVQGRILRPYAPDMPGWYLCVMTDEGGEYRGGFSANRMRVIGNR